MFELAETLYDAGYTSIQDMAGREGARLLGTIVDTPHQPLTPILADLPEGFDGLVQRILSQTAF